MPEGKKHVLDTEPGHEGSQRLLTLTRDHGLPADCRYLSVIDGAKRGELTRR